MEKESHGARAGEGSDHTGAFERELKRRPLPGARVGSSTQSLNLPSAPIEAMRFGWMVGGSH
jgi:hypothetical protein